MGKSKTSGEPVRSMTGFGQGEAEAGGRTLAAEIRTVNHRFLELSIRLPRGFQNLEGKLRSELQDRLGRGKVNLTVAWKGEADSGALGWDESLAERYYELLQTVRSRFDFREPVTLGHLVAHPEILSYREPEIAPTDAWKLLRKVVGAAVDDLVSMRETEGKALAKDLRTRITSLRKNVKTVEKRSPHRAKEAKERLRSRIEELLAGAADLDQERLLVEAAFQAERMDCTEECVRMASHLDQFVELLDEGGVIGRKLNFLLQEMNREANTIGSKANDVAVAREVIQVKEEIEILREQIQNLE